MWGPQEPVPSHEGLGGIPVGVRLAGVTRRWVGRVWQEERSETVGGPRAPLLLAEGACAWPPLRALMCAVRASPGTRTSLHGSVHQSPRVSVVFTACSLLVVNGVQRGGSGAGTLC